MVNRTVVGGNQIPMLRHTFLKTRLNDSELYWLGLGNWVNQPSIQFAQYNDLNGTWFTRIPNPN